MCKHKLTYSY